jgi:pimeloyl-ACP methyl ester carboxylesterase
MFKKVQWLWVLFLLSLIAPVAAQQTDSVTIPPRPEAPGQRVDVGGYQLHIDCQGEGSPTVILEPGFARFSLNERALQGQLASLTRVCVYDHAGFGWSDLAPTARTTPQLVTELETLLQNADIGGPYILIGQSLGGFVVRLFASQHPDDVAGVILVEATPPDFLKQITGAQSGPDGLQLALKAALQTATDNNWTTQSLLPILSLTDDVAPDQRDNFIALATAPTYIEAALAEWEIRLANADAVIEAGDLGNTALVVLVGGDRLTRLNAEDLLWLPAQVQQAKLSSRSRMIIAQNSIHSIALDQPEAIIDALDWVLAQQAS